MRIALGLTLAFLVLELIAGVVAESLALISDAARMLSDVAALGAAVFIAFEAYRRLRQPPEIQPVACW